VEEDLMRGTYGTPISVPRSRGTYGPRIGADTAPTAVAEKTPWWKGALVFGGLVTVGYFVFGPSMKRSVGTLNRHRAYVRDVVGISPSMSDEQKAAAWDRFYAKRSYLDNMPEGR
jgi:hypothetical protein